MLAFLVDWGDCFDDEGDILWFRRNFHKHGGTGEHKVVGGESQGLLSDHGY